jgi:hypothetical protein
MGMMMPGWYDLNSLDAIDQREDAAGLAESLRCAALRCVSLSRFALLDREVLESACC